MLVVERPFDARPRAGQLDERADERVVVRGVPHEASRDHRPVAQWERDHAGVLEAAGGAIRIEQRDFTAGRLAREIAALSNDPARLSKMALGAKSCGTTDAAERLADLVIKVAGI